MPTSRTDGIMIDSSARNSALIFTGCAGNPPATATRGATDGCIDKTQIGHTQRRWITARAPAAAHVAHPKTTPAPVLHRPGVSRLRRRDGVIVTLLSTLLTVLGLALTPTADAAWYGLALPRAGESVQLAGHRIAVYTPDERLLVKDGPTAPWIEVARWIKSYQLEGDRIAVHTGDDRLLVKEGPPDAGWTVVSGWLKSYRLEGDRIAVLQNDDQLYVKYGPLDAAWIAVANSPKSYQLEGDRIAVLDGADRLHIKDGRPDASWVDIASSPKSYQLEGNRIAVLDGADRLRVKDGRPDAGWIDVASSPKSYQLADDRIAVHTGDDRLLVKDGPADARWVDVNVIVPPGFRVKYVAHSPYVIALAWDAESSDVRDVLQRREAGTTVWHAMFDGAGAQSYRDTDVQAGRTYEYRLMAIAPSGASAWTPVLTARVRPVGIALTGTFRYADPDPATGSSQLRAIAHAEVEIWSFRPRVLGAWAWGKDSTATTDGNGVMSAELPLETSGSVYAVKVFASNYAASVWPNDAVHTVPFHQEPGQPDGVNLHRAAYSAGAVLDFSYRFRDNWTSQHYNLAETVRRGYDFVSARRGDDDPLPKANVQPTSASPTGTYYNPAADTLVISSDDVYYDLGILHEYAHFVEESISAFPWLPTKHDGCLARDVVGNVTNSAEHAWMEGFADWFAQAAAGTTPEASLSGLRGTPEVKKLETPPCSGLPPYVTPERVEFFVAGSLWDLYDRASDAGSLPETADSLERRDRAVIEIMDKELDISPANPTIWDFRRAWRSRGLPAAELDAILSLNHITPPTSCRVSQRAGPLARPNRFGGQARGGHPPCRRRSGKGSPAAGERTTVTVASG